MSEREFGGQRKEDRLTVNKEFRSVDQFIVEYVQNISKTGAFIKSDDPLPVGTQVILKFTLIMDDLETLEGEGKVVRVVEAGGDETPGMGVVFTKLTHYSEKMLNLLLEHRDA